MSLPKGKRDFIRKLVVDVNEVTEIKRIMNQIGREPTNKIDHMIKKQFLIRNDNGEYTVNNVNFRMGISVLDFDLLAKMLLRLDQLGFNLQELYIQTKPNPLYFSQEDMLYARLIASDDITSFTDLILY
jgi:hypothetical protein|tara:strand:+ start:124 stop:510 length:387 start_codon:yes stop_codon:yes gene_type:complete